MTDALPTLYPAAGEIVDGKYKIEKILGEGGMGAVARATHVVLGGTVALKFMNPQFMSFPGAVERFVNEGRASKAIKSDHVLPVNDVGLLPNGTPYLLMECLYGLDLADLLARDGPTGLPIRRAAHFVIQILRGLQAAHAIGIIHRDMKPSNCFVVTHDGEGDFVKILDFGISKVVQPGSSSLTQTNSALGTPLYMSPEQARSPRDVDSRSDLYSVGVILYELLSGHTPFFSASGEFTEILYQLFTADPPPIKQARPELPDELAAVVHKALARDANERYATALEMAEALIPFASDTSAALVERMRGFKPPSKSSLIPADGLPTSMAAFSKLQRGQGSGTDLMPNRPTTDVQKGPPVTELLPDAPKEPPQLETQLLETPKGGSVAAVPELLSMRARPDEVLGRTQIDVDPRSPSPAPPRTTRGDQTDLGAVVASASQASSKRSPLIYAVPAVVILGLAVGVGLVIVRDKAPASPAPMPSVSGAVTPPLATPPLATPPLATPPLATPPLATSPLATSEEAALTSLTHSAAPTPSATASASVDTAPDTAPASAVSAPASGSAAPAIRPPTRSPTPPSNKKSPGYIPGLDTTIRD